MQNARCTRCQQPIGPNDRGWRWSEELDLFLGIHFLGIHDRQLRYFTRQGDLIPTLAEQAEIERQQRELAEQQLSEMEALLNLYRERFGELP